MERHQLRHALALLVGISAALLYRRTGSIWAGAVVHVTTNTAAVLLPVLVALARRAAVRS